MIPRQRTAPPDEHYPPATLAAAIAGDRQAFGQLWRAHYDEVMRFVYYRVDSRQLAEDITADAFTRAMINITGFRAIRGGFPAWVITIARNLIADRFRRSRTRREIATADLLDADQIIDGPEDGVLAGITHTALHDAVGRLNDHQWACVQARFFDELTIDETSTRLGIGDRAVKTLQWRAVQRLARDPALIGATTMSTTWTIALPPGYRPLAGRGLFACGSNARLHPMVRARVTREIRGAAKIAALAARVPAMTGPVAILAIQHPATGGRGLDPDNIAPLVKPFIDGLRDAGVLADDSPRHVTEVRYKVGDRRQGGQLVLHLFAADATEAAA